MIFDMFSGCLGANVAATAVAIALNLHIWKWNGKCTHSYGHISLSSTNAIAQNLINAMLCGAEHELSFTRNSNPPFSHH